MRTDNNKATNEKDRQEEDDKEDEEEAATATAATVTGEGNDCVGSIRVLLVLVCQRRKRNQINDIKLM